VIDLERDVRELLERRAEEASGRAGYRMPPKMRSRVRGRQARALIMSGLAVALVAAGALAGARGLVPRTDRQPANQPPTPLFPREATPKRMVVASGEFRGHQWKLTVGRERELWCYGVEMDTGAAGSCAKDLLSRDPLEVSTSSQTAYPAVVVSGLVSNDVDRVVFDLDAGGRIDGRVFPTPPELKAPFDAFLVLIPEERPARGLVLAIDAEGEVLARHGVYVTPSLEDTHGNVVGFISKSEAEPYSLNWIEPGTPLGKARIEDIRQVAALPLVEIWTEIREWWDRRPAADASDDAFLDWWASYPVTEAREQ
jgi:hypothetical protein